MPLRAVRGAVCVEADEPEEILDAVQELLTEMLCRNDLTIDELVSVIFTSTPDLRAEFPAVAARRLGIVDVPLLCAAEIDVPGALARVVRVLMHVETARSRQEVRHTYLRGAEVLRLDIAQ